MAINWLSTRIQIVGATFGNGYYLINSSPDTSDQRMVYTPYATFKIGTQTYSPGTWYAFNRTGAMIGTFSSIDAAKAAAESS